MNMRVWKRLIQPIIPNSGLIFTIFLNCWSIQKYLKYVARFPISQTMPEILINKNSCVPCDRLQNSGWLIHNIHTKYKN